jgi:hypothetical protein
MSDKTVVVTHLLLHISSDHQYMDDGPDDPGPQTMVLELSEAIELNLDEVHFLSARPVYGRACDGLDIIDVRTESKLSFVMFSVHRTDWPRVAYDFLCSLNRKFLEISL